MTERTPTRIVAAGDGPRFLGSSTLERNRRIAARAAASAHGAPAGTLTVPADAILTPAAIAALPPQGAWRLEWAGAREPLTWRAGGSAEAPILTAALPDGAVLDVATRTARWRATWRLLRASGKPTDGWISRHVHRRVSRPISMVLLQLGVSANTATLLTFGAGLAAAWLLAQTSHASMVAGGLLFWFASMADGVDGEIARLTLTESPRGEQLDTMVDDATYAVCYGGALVGWWRQGIGPAGWLLAAGAAAALVATVMWATRLVKRATRTPAERRFVPLTPVEYAVKDTARATRRLPLRAAAAGFQIFRREQFSLVLFALTLITGRRAALVAAVAAGLGTALAVLVIYRRDLERAMRARAGTRDRPMPASATP